MRQQSSGSGANEKKMLNRIFIKDRGFSEESGSKHKTCTICSCKTVNIFSTIQWRKIIEWLTGAVDTMCVKRQHANVVVYPPNIVPRLS